MIVKFYVLTNTKQNAKLHVPLISRFYLAMILSYNTKCLFAEEQRKDGCGRTNALYDE